MDIKDEKDIALNAIDGEVEDDATSDVADSNTNGAAGLLNLEELINNHLESIEKLKDELKTAREMFEDSFNNNPTYNEHIKKVQEVSKAKNSVRQEIAKQPSVATIEQKVKDLRFDIGESSKTLSDLLQDYKDQTGATSIETRKGEVLEIVSTARLVRSKSAK